MADGHAEHLDQLEAMITTLAAALPAETRSTRGRPLLLPAAVLWAALAIGVLRGGMHLAAIWRTIVTRTWWHQGQVQISPSAVTKRLKQADPAVMEQFFHAMTAQLVAQQAQAPCAELAPFATAVIALDESTLDPVLRKLPSLRDLPVGSAQLLPGKMTACFDLRRQLFHSVTIQDTPRQNERVAARAAVAALPPGTLILADLGYFSFRWFDDLTDAGHFWLSRLRAKTSYEIAHPLYDQDGIFDGLVWLGAHRADRAKHLVRVLRFPYQGRMQAYVTNVTDPHLLSLADAAALYARRWDIELAFNLAKTDLHLHFLWSGDATLIRHQVWAVLLIAQLILALRSTVAAQADVDCFEVSLALLVTYLPQYARTYDDPIAAYIAHGRALGFLRPSRRTQIRAPELPLSALCPPPDGLCRTRTPRYAGRQ
jgi:hypothetical protein